MERDKGFKRNSTILLVDDQIEITEVFNEILKESGYQTIVAGDGQEAVEHYFKYQPNLVIMDISLVKMNGDEATELILKKDPKAKILILTSLKGERVDRALSAGAVDIVSKPISIKDLLNKIKEVLGGGISGEKNQTA